MRIPIPIYAQVLILFGINVLLVVCAVLMLFRIQQNMGYTPLLHGHAAYRLQAEAEEIAETLRDSHHGMWEADLKDASEKLGLTLYLVDIYRGVVAGPPENPPNQVLGEAELMSRAYRVARQDGPLATPLFMIRAGDPERYWIGIRLDVSESDYRHAPGTVLLIETESFTANGLLFDWRPWALGALALMVGAALLWLPFIHGVNSYLRELTEATEEIAAGRFGVKIDGRRGDELGRLGAAIQRMAYRLDGLVNDQKRFLGGIAHEMCSPLARMKMALGVVEEKATGRQAQYMADVREEADLMSGMIDELLSFSKQSLDDAGITPEPVEIAQVVNIVLRRELFGHTEVQVEVPEDLVAIGNEDMLVRAIGNLVRNALKYAGDSGPVRLTGLTRGNRIELIVADRGPGVPEESLPRLFDPFYRVDSSRSRATGGTGLGLTIVQRCVEICGGTVSARNREGGGLAMTIRLKKVED